MTRPIRRILFVTDAVVFGGAERYLLDMAAAARRIGIEAHICWLNRSDAWQDIFAGARNAGISVHGGPAIVPGGRDDTGHGGRQDARLPWGLVEACRQQAGTVRALYHHLRAVRPDALIINASGRRGFWGVSWIARMSGVPSAWVHHMVEGQELQRIPPRWFGGRVEGPQWWRVPQALRHRLAAEGANLVIVSNEADRDCIARCHGIARPRIEVIPPGIDARRFRFDSAGRERLRADWGITDPGERASCPSSSGERTLSAPFVIGTAARLVPRKGIERLIEATALLRGRGIPAVTLIAGDGPQRRAFAEHAARNGVRDTIHFVGFIEEMVAFHSALDVFVLASETESFGLALAEAMACARPVVATPTAGARRQIRHLETGWQLAGFHAGELADALAVLHESPPLRDRLGRHARAAGDSTIDQTLDRTLQAFLPRRRSSCTAGHCAAWQAGGAV